MKEVIISSSAPQAIGPYSQAITAGNMVFVSGQLPIIPNTGELASDIESQTRQAFANVEAILVAAGCTLSNIVKVTLYLKNLADFKHVNDVYSTIFSEQYPARAAVEVSALPKDALIEIDVIACKF